MKRVLIVLDGIVAKKVLQRLVLIDTSHSLYDVVYTDDDILIPNIPSNFTFYKFDSTSFSKLNSVMSNVIYSDALLVLFHKEDLLATIKNIEIINPTLNISIYNNWDLKFDNPNIQNYNGIEVLANGLIEQLPNIPVVAQNIGLKQGEIMQIKIPFGSAYAYRYVGSISQSEWKIFAIYRNNILINVKATSILKPNDIILVIGKPKILLQVFKFISESYGHFPMPFGKNIYVFIDLYIQTIDDAINSLKKARLLQQRMNNYNLIIKITRPTTIEDINSLKEIVKETKNTIIGIDYSNQPIENIIQEDINQYDVGLFVLTNTLLKESIIKSQLIDLKIPIFKVGIENINEIKTTIVVLDKMSYYEQLSPIIFDIASQLKHQIKVIDSEPLEDNSNEQLLKYFDDLSKVYNLTLKINTNHKNPIRELKKEQNVLQILPLTQELFETRVMDFFTTNSDLLSYDLKYLNQIIIPIVEENEE